jgi:ribonuclease HI
MKLQNLRSQPALLYADGGVDDGVGYYSVARLKADMQPEFYVYRVPCVSYDSKARKKVWTTNNQAEHLALLEALLQTQHRGFGYVNIKMDSQLVVRQFNRRYQTKDDELKELVTRSWSVYKELTDRNVEVDVNWVPREEVVEVIGH